MFMSYTHWFAVVLQLPGLRLFGFIVELALTQKGRIASLLLFLIGDRNAGKGTSDQP